MEIQEGGCLEGLGMPVFSFVESFLLKALAALTVDFFFFFISHSGQGVGKK